MDMTISNVVTGPGFAQPPDFLKFPPIKSAEEKAAIEKIVASLPGNGGYLEIKQQPEIHSIAADIEQVSLTFNRRLQFVVDQEAHEITVKVIDKNTDKVIKVLPPEELQRLHRRLKETIGLLYNNKV